MASVLSLLFFLLSFMLPISIIAQSNGNFLVGSNLTATANSSSSWRSASGDFALGFYQLGSEDLFLLSIWYAKIPDKTIVWYADKGRSVPSGSTASITSGDGLVLNGPKGEEIWKSNPNRGSVASATMNNTGNFVLISSDSQVLWESFKNPTDTILPTQIMERGSVVSSRLTETNFTTGRFQLRLLEDGNLVLNSINLPSTYANEAYYISGTYDEISTTNSGYQLVFNESGYMFILRENNRTFALTSGEAGSEADYYYKATLSPYGVFTQYRHLKNSSGNWSVIWSEPDNICGESLVNAGSGVCGYNSVCKLNIDRRPICECPPGYSLLDPNDAYGSCKQDLELSCAEEARLMSSAEDLYKVEDLANTDWPLSDTVLFRPYTADQCRESCLHDCMCAVAIFGLGDSCWIKRQPLSNGRIDNSRTAFIKIRKDITTSGSVLLGSNLTATANSTSSWRSASGDFALGFYQPGSEDLFLLSIWYAKIPDKTIVWYADEGRSVPSGSTASITSGDGLVLNGPKGEEIWKSNPNIGTVASATMNNTGNFVLISSDSQVLWESFKNPTDTILPTQIMERGSVVSSRLTEKNFTTGRFQLRLLEDGNLVLNSINLPSTYANEAYYISGTYDENSTTNSGYQLVFNESGYMFILRENNRTFALTSGEAGSEADYYYRATLSPYGVFTQYRHLKNSSGNWSVIWSEPDNICGKSLVDSGSGVCGYNNICKLNSERRPICECPPGYSLIDPNDAYGSCKQNLELSCAEEARLMSSAEDLYTVEDLANTDWPLSDYALLKPYTADLCRESCLHDCMCAVAIFGLGDSCWKKKLPLSNGRIDNSRRAFMKIRKDNTTSGPDPHLPFPDMKRKDQDSLILAGSVLLGGSVFLNSILVATVCYWFFFISSKKNRKTHQARGSSMETNLRCFAYEELVEATDGFKEEVGRGAFGIVYKGELQIGSNYDFVAVKKLDKVLQDGEKEFKTEVNVIGQTHQKNLVRLLGFCDEGQHRLLVYEFMRNGTLANFLFGDSKPSWSQRTGLAFGIAKGLLYLHEECNTQIIHCDIKPQNILLDDYYNARISDFGLAKLLMIGQSHTNTGIRGTKGYVAPEWFRNMPITVKVDVYSFGVLLLEVISCRRSVEMENHLEDRAILTDWAYDCYRAGTLDALVDDDPEALNNMVKLERFVMVAIWCIQEDPSLRPTMRKVTLMLEGVVEVSVPPCLYPFSIATSI